MIPAALLVVLLLMAAELWHSRRNERKLRARGAWEPSGDVYRQMTWAYPLAFVGPGVEGMLRGPVPPLLMAAGIAVFVCAKALKFWAIASLGERWTFRVLVLAEPLVSTGPYCYLRHPNYAAVLGEIAGFAVFAGAPVAGLISLAGFGELMRRRIRVEEQALGHPPCT